MYQVRKAAERGHANYGWLNTYHTFSFSSYHDPKHMRFRNLRVMNEDFIAPGQGFGTHPHNDMEIVTYVLQGALEHRDSMGNGEVLRPGEFQRMSAGTGITHSEFNPSASEATHLYQIWLQPERRGIEPSYEQKKFDLSERTNRLRLVASPGGEDGSLTIHTPAKIYLSTVHPQHTVQLTMGEGKYIWLQILSGSGVVGGYTLEAGDGLAISDEALMEYQSTSESEILVFELA
jgi:redox-sensitive bicupin YhaK (pirin superfamily)